MIWMQSRKPKATAAAWCNRRMQMAKHHNSCFRTQEPSGVTQKNSLGGSHTQRKALSSVYFATFSSGYSLRSPIEFRFYRSLATHAL